MILSKEIGGTMTNIQKLIKEKSDDFLAEVIGDYICEEREKRDTCYKCPFFDSKDCSAEFKAWLKQESKE